LFQFQRLSSFSFSTTHPLLAEFLFFVINIAALKII
jgi:hypothetical protein